MKDVMKLLPLGSVLRLKGSQKPVMVIGVCPQSQNEHGEAVMNDYIGVMYPEGYISSNLFMVFNSEDIDEVVVEGYRGSGEWEQYLNLVEKALEVLYNKEKSAAIDEDTAKDLI